MDNRYFINNCPPLMQDARFLTNYSDKRIIDQQVRTINNINTIYDYKSYLQTNAEKIMKNQIQETINLNTCSVNCMTPISKLQ